MIIDIKLTRITAAINKVKSLKKLIGDLSLYMLATIITSLIGVIINPFLAVNLSPNDYAVIGYFTSFNSLILPIISFSFISYYSKNYFKIKKEKRQSVLDTLLISQLIFGLVALFIVLIGFYFYIKINKVNFHFYPFALLCFIPVFFSCFYNFLLVEKRMQRQAFSFFKIVLLNALFGAVFAILFVVVLKKGANGRFWAILIPVVGLGIYSFTKLISKYQFDRKIFLEAINFGWPISLSAILFYFLSGIDRAILEKLNDNYTYGIYTVAVQLTTYLTIFYTAIKQTFEPDIYSAIANNNRKKLIIIIMVIISLSTLPNLLFILFARPLINILTFGRYMESTTFAQILAVKNIPMSLCFIVSTVIVGYGFPKIELMNRALGAFLAVIMFKIMIDKFDFYGAAWGQSIAFLMMTMISSVFIIRKLIKPNR